MATEPNPKIGDLRHRVTIQIPVKGVDADGTVTRGWTTDATVWASVKLVKRPGKIDSVAERAEASNLYEMDMRYREIPPNARIIFEDRYHYVINSGDIWGYQTWLRVWTDVRPGEK